MSLNKINLLLRKKRQRRSGNDQRLWSKHKEERKQEKESTDRSLTNFRIGLININGLTSDKFNNLITYTQDMALDANILTGGGGSMGGSIGRPDSSRPASACAVQVSMIESQLWCGPSGNVAGMPRPRLFAADSGCGATAEAEENYTH